MSLRYAPRCRLGWWLLPLLLASSSGVALGISEATAVDIRGVDYDGGEPAPRATAAQRLAWEVRQRTSVETRLSPLRVRLDDPRIFDNPLLYFAGDRAFPPLSEAELSGLKRFVEFGGFVLFDDAAPGQQGFDSSVRREIARAFGDGSLTRIPADHTVYRSFYLLDGPSGRVRGPDFIEAVMRNGRAAVIYSRHDLGGAWDRDNLGNYLHEMEQGGETQREVALRFGVNLVLYALCLDYKDDQVHAPFIMRRRAGSR